MSNVSTNTLKQVSKSFERINKKTGDLNTCSTDDFSLLSSRFRNSFESTNILRRNAIQIKELILKIYTGDTVNDIKRLFNTKQQIEISATELKKIISEGAFSFVLNEDVFYLQLHNLIQDLTTLQLLIATIRLGNQEIIETDFLKCDKQINKFIESIRSFYLKTQDIKQTYRLSRILEDQTIVEEKNIEETLATLKTRLDERHALLAEQLVLADTAEKVSGRSLSEVVTNLQFEDIIRQKMEHVSAMQIVTASELSNINPEHLKDEDNLIALARVREISDLQVAQLLHTSKDYQSAIQSIINEFATIAQSLQHFTTLGNLLLSHSKHSYHYQIIETVTNKYFELNKLYNQSELNDQVIEGFKQIFSLFNTFAIILDAFAEDIEKHASVIQSNTVSQQQKNLLQDITDGIKFKINNLTQQHAIFASNYIQKIHPFEGTVEHKHFYLLVKSFESEYQQIKKQITERENLLLDKIKENKKTVSSLQKELTIGVKRIKFYNQYDTLTKSIISEFDKIHKLIAFTQTIDIGDDVISRFKSLYTMQSEHMVHDKIHDNSTEGLMIEYESSIELF